MTSLASVSFSISRRRMHCPLAATFKPEPLSYLLIFCLGTNILRVNMRVSKIVPFSEVILLITVLFAGVVVFLQWHSTI